MIKVLSDALISQIAAGEVIERPASALKELLENSVDADASVIAIEIEEGGLRKIRVVDDGHGMSADDARMAFERHATSKISDLADLDAIRSLGFRGEALASIASVARVVMKTRRADDRVGTRLEIDGGREVAFEEDACAAGTDIAIFGLFHHTPARRKYMKTERTEYGQIFDMTCQVALAHPRIGFRLLRDGSEVFTLPAGQSLRERVRVLFGGPVADALIPVTFQQSNLIVSGFVGKPELARASRKYQFVFVNDRPIENRMIAHAVKEAFHSLLMHEKFPWYVLDIQIDPQFVDVNVHPRKLEVKFVNQQEVYKAVMGSVHHALEGSMLGPVLGPVLGDNASYASGMGRAGAIGANFSANFRTGTESQPEVFVPGQKLNLEGRAAGRGLQGELRPGEILQFDLAADATAIGVAGEQRSLRTFDVQGTVLRPVAQIAASYIVAESEDGLVLIDQHAAHERVRYAQLMEALEKEQPVSQKLLTPLEMDLGVEGAEFVSENLADFAAIGFEIEHFGGNTFLLRSVPAGIEKQEPERVLKDMLAGAKLGAETQSSAGIQSGMGANVKNVREYILTFTACRGAVKFGDRLTMIEMEALVSDMEKTKHAAHCPHGRPAIVKLTFEKLEEMFKRRNF